MDQFPPFDPSFVSPNIPSIPCWNMMCHEIGVSGDENKTTSFFLLPQVKQDFLPLLQNTLGLDTLTEALDRICASGVVSGGNISKNVVYFDDVYPIKTQQMENKIGGNELCNECDYYTLGLNIASNKNEENTCLSYAASSFFKISPSLFNQVITDIQSNENNDSSVGVAVSKDIGSSSSSSSSSSDNSSLLISLLSNVDSASQKSVFKGSFYLINLVKSTKELFTRRLLQFFNKNTLIMKEEEDDERQRIKIAVLERERRKKEEFIHKRKEEIEKEKEKERLLEKEKQKQNTSANTDGASKVVSPGEVVFLREMVTRLKERTTKQEEEIRLLMEEKNLRQEQNRGENETEKEEQLNKLREEVNELKLKCDEGNISKQKNEENIVLIKELTEEISLMKQEIKKKDVQIQSLQMQMTTLGFSGEENTETGNLKINQEQQLKKLALEDENSNLKKKLEEKEEIIANLKKEKDLLSEKYDNLIKEHEKLKGILSDLEV
jgi:hypothetical protein